jgi:hypothetical protein
MLIRFIKATYHPRKRSYYPDYKAGMVYNLPDDEANYHIKQGEAIRVNSIIDKLVKKPQNRPMVDLAKVLGMTPTPLKTIKLKIRDPQAERELKSKGLLREMQTYFDGVGDVPVKDIAGLLLTLMNYAVDIKDDLMIKKIAGDLQTLLRLTQYHEYNQKRKNDKSL